MEKLLRFLITFMMILGIATMANAGQYSPAWQEYLASHSQDQMVGAIITMADQVDLRALQDHLYAIHADRQLWHQTVMLALQDKATTTQADILAQLADLQAQGQVSHYKGLWVGNVIVVNATPAVFDLLASRSDVERVSPDYPIQGIEPVDEHSGDQPTIARVENGLKAIGADSCWAIGITGDGRLVSHLDTGVDGNHVALAARWRGVADSRYAGHPDWAWYDPVTNTDFPFDDGQHGTHTMGTMCGLGAGTGDTVGVAFGAQWISAGVIDRVSIPRTVQDALTAFQWITDPDDDPSTVWDVPDVNSNSWGLTPAFGYPMCDETFWVVLDGCEAAGVVVNFAAGNEGPGRQSLRSPADRATTDTKSFAVGAVNGNQFPDCPIADFSSRGPSFCTPLGDSAIKPEVSAPGVSVRSCMPGNGYQYMSGTSMATPHVSGAVALIRQANPNLSSEQVHQILMETAVDKGAPGEDNNYGAGVINVYEAVLRAMAMLNGWGMLAGVITDEATGNPIAGAHVTILNRTPQLSTTSNTSGHYSLFAPSDTTWQIRVDFPPTYFPDFDTVTLVNGDTTFRNYVLEGKVEVLLKASFGNPTNVDYRSFYIKGSWNSEGSWDSSWSAPQIEIKDNGVAPDSVSGDGIFTGLVLLARDTVHTYSWAVYSENYSGEASRLQSGADIQIFNPTPPAIPTLIVNPSGSYNNWMISAIGTNGLNLDLAQNYRNHATSWGAACSLFVPNSYTFRFKVMHSDVASYGSGGLAGADLTFTPPVSGSYIIVFDDSNDLYYIQMTGTQGPPTNLVATSGLDHHVTLAWHVPILMQSPMIGDNALSAKAVANPYGNPVISGRDPIAPGILVLAGYNMYRDSLPFPYDRALRVNSNLIPSNSYDDHGGLQGRIQNGVTYYYQAAAVYDIGGGQLVEAGPSLPASAIPVNHAPVAATDPVANAIDRDIHLRWHFIDDVGDFSHFSVEREQMPNGNWAQIATVTDTLYDDPIPDGQDGTYGYRITTYDDANPPLLSPPTNPVYAMVGHLPPSNLAAISNHEFQIPLNWRLPGGWGVQGLGSQNPLGLANQDENEFSLSSNIPPSDNPILFDRGGPDAYGYYWVDSDELDGPVYGWLDITAQGIQIPMNTDNQNLGPFDFGFDFPFYGNNFSSFFVCSNGWLSFTDSTDAYATNRALPGASSVPFNLVAPFWDDLTFASGGQLWYYSDGAECVISYIAVPHVTSGGPYTFQVILRSSGTILFQYGSMGTPVNSATVGIQNSDGTVGLQIVYNADYIHDNLAVLLRNSVEGTAPVHYKLYRSQASPVPADPAHLITGAIGGDQATYIDTTGIVNGTTYYYVLSAVWPDSIESPTSNEASGSATNYAPEPPASLVGQVNNRDIDLHWSFTNLKHDLDHFNIYTKLLPNGTWNLAASSDDTTGVITIPDGQDGIYAISVTAVDNGIPPLESVRSHTISFAIGHLPPTQLNARSNYDLEVPLSWQRPGSWLEEIQQSARGAISLKLISNSPSDQPVLFDRGGPDAYGYYWVDSDELDGPVYGWLDITAQGIQIPMNTDNQNLGPFDFGFDSPFYGNNFSSFHICSNGWLSFTDSTDAYATNRALPGASSVPFNLVAPFWDDLTFATGGQLWYYSDGAECVISYIAVPHVTSGGPYTFQVILRSSGTILFQYGSMGTPVNSATVGIQNSDGTVGLQIVYNADYIHDNLAVLLRNSVEGTAPVHYKLYRSQTSPVPADPAHLITGAIGGDQATYIDTTGIVNGTTYYYVLSAVWPDSIESPTSNEASARPVTGARIDIDPISFDITGQSGSVTLDTLNLSNPGGLDLNWAIAANGDIFLDAPAAHPSEDRSTQTSDENHAILSEAQGDSENPPMLLGRGGPDAFGYQWIDSDELGGPTYQWADIVGRGQQLTMPNDNNQGPFAMGFEFPLYDNIFDSLRICSNGWISFTSPYSGAYNYALPSQFAPQNLIAPFWDDLDPSAGGQVWYYSNSDSAVVSWIAVPHRTSGGPYTFQVVLTTSGAIYFNYSDMTAPLNGATIGIQNADRSIGLQVAFNQNYVHNLMTVRISTSWISVSPASGILSVGLNTNIVISCDASFLSSGTYTGSLVVSGNDINHQLANVTIPVTFHVTPTGISDNSSELPKEFALSQNYPNPFNPTTRIEFALPTKSLVSLEIYNILGQRVRTLVDGVMAAGYKSVTWNGTDQSGQAVASGTYFYRLTTADKVITKKMTMLK